jgi:three-Cys-motif partner protein
MADLKDYEEREQAWVKHWLLREYLRRLIFKVATKWNRFVYVDGFAGPWGAKTENLSDTSFGIALEVMRECQSKLAENGRVVPMRAAFFEKNRRRAVLLSQYAKENSTHELSIEAYRADFMDHIDAVSAQLRDDDFAFVLLDPKGYKEMIPAKLTPLLRQRGVEVLINLMWDFINRFWETDQAPVLDEIFGSNRRQECSKNHREKDVSNLFAERLRSAAGLEGGRMYAATFPVQHATKDRTHYFLVYATHSPHGLLTFGDVAQATWQEQAMTKARTTVRQRSDGIDLFDGEVLGVKNEREVDKHLIREAWLSLMPDAGAELVVRHETMAGLLESCGCLPADLQRVALELIRDGVLENASVTSTAMARRTKNAVILDKVETLRRLR